MIRLSPMSESEMRDFLGSLASRYADNLVEAGDASSNERALARVPPFDQVLPDGLATPGMFLWHIEDQETAERVGALWFGVRDRQGDRDGFIFDLIIHEPHRGKGYGRATLSALDEEAGKLGVPRITLHVFGFNTPARTLYQRLGYREQSIIMAKERGGSVEQGAE